jgi:hypothetical protein
MTVNNTHSSHKPPGLANVVLAMDFHACNWTPYCKVTPKHLYSDEWIFQTHYIYIYILRYHDEHQKPQHLGNVDLEVIQACPYQNFKIELWQVRQKATADPLTFCLPHYINQSLYTGSSGSIVSDYGLDDRGSIPGRGRGIFFSPLHPDRLWGPPSLLSNGYRGSFPRGYSAAGAWRWPLTPI